MIHRDPRQSCNQLAASTATPKAAKPKTGGAQTSEPRTAELKTGGPKIEVTILEAWGSTPREAGTCMWVTAASSGGTIGGGRMEWLAMRHARNLIEQVALACIEASGNEEPSLPPIEEKDATLDLPLGPKTQQCCGGFVRLGFQWADAASLSAENWRPRVYLHGQGHVGRAALRALEPLPFLVVGVDQRPEFEANQTDHHKAIAEAPPESWHIVMTHDHALDLALCSALLQRPDVGHIGLIGSQTKRTRFFKQLRLQGLDPGAIVCPIGLMGISGKEPEVIAASLAAELLALRSAAMVSSREPARQA